MPIIARALQRVSSGTVESKPCPSNESAGHLFIIVAAEQWSNANYKFTSKLQLCVASLIKSFIALFKAS